MILLSLVLVIVAAVALVLGWMQDGLQLVYVSIATCVAAMAVLGVGVLLRRRAEATQAPAGYAAPARTSAPVTTARRGGGSVPTVTTDADAEEVAEVTAGDGDGGAASASAEDAADAADAPSTAGEDADQAPTADAEGAAGAAGAAPSHAPADAATRGGDDGSLDAVDGLGTAQRQALLARFGDERGIAGASIAELTAVPGVGTRLARAIKAELR